MKWLLVGYTLAAVVLTGSPLTLVGAGARVAHGAQSIPAKRVSKQRAKGKVRPVPSRARRFGDDSRSLRAGVSLRSAIAAKAQRSRVSLRAKRGTGKAAVPGKKVRLSKARARTVRPSRQTVASKSTQPAQTRIAGGLRSMRALVRGVAIDGPRHTWSAIKRNPIAFLGGWMAIGAVGVAGQYLGFNGEFIALGVSGAAVVAQVKAAWPSLKRARGADRLRIVGSEVVWPALFWTTSTLIGHNLAQHGGGGHHGSANPVNTFVSTAIVGSDGPALGVTALDSVRGRNQAPAAPGH